MADEAWKEQLERLFYNKNEPPAPVEDERQSPERSVSNDQFEGEEKFTRSLEEQLEGLFSGMEEQLAEVDEPQSPPQPQSTARIHEEKQVTRALETKDGDGRETSNPRVMFGPKLYLRIVAALLVIAGLAYTFWPRPVSPNPSLAETPTTSSATTATTSATPQAVGMSSRLEIPTPRPEEISLTLTPAPGAVGWATSLDGRSHFDVPNIHTGHFNGHVYHGALQFDLSAVPSEATLTYAALELTGLDAQNIGPNGTWHLQLLAPAIDVAWPSLTYEMLHEAGVELMVSPILTSADLAQDRVNGFQFGPEQLAVLQSHLANGVVSFRLDGPTSETDNLFTWTSGYGPEAGLETQPVLHLVANAPSSSASEVVVATSPTAAEFVIVTSTPTPENIITVVAIAATATEVAANIGTYTPAPENWVTPVIVVPQPSPANAATVAYQETVAAAEAFLFGPPTSTPINMWTVTPTPTDLAVTTGQPRPIEVIVTSTPTPENIITVAAMAAIATQVATTIGTYTPVPDNWATPIVITLEPSPANVATAAHREALATAEAYLYGTATPTLINVWTATPTPIFVPIDGEVATPFVTATPTATPRPIPSELVGKIAFLSNRSGGSEPLKNPLVYLIDPDGSNLAVLTDRIFYDEAEARDPYSADQRFRAFVKDAIRFDNERVPAIYFYDYFYNAEEQITHFGAGFAWDPVWSPTREQIAFVSNESQDDEIWVVDRGGSNLRRLTSTNEAFNARKIGKDTFIPEVNGHPSWSPNGSQIVFWSNRTGNRQIWVMNRDGTNVYSLSTTNHDDWNPVWIKYIDPARDPVPDFARGSSENP